MQHTDLHDLGFGHDLQTMIRRGAERRVLLRRLAAGSLLPLLGCGGGDDDSASTSTSTDTSTGTSSGS
jgi:hypothetical protein